MYRLGYPFNSNIVSADLAKRQGAKQVLGGFTKGRFYKKERKSLMLYTIAVVLLLLWLLGMVSSYTIGGFIHILLVIAIVVVLLRIISGRKPF